MAFLMLMVFLLTGAGKALAENAQFPTPPQDSYDFTSQVYVFTPANSGTLSMSGAYLDSEGKMWYETWTGSTQTSKVLKQTSKGTYSNGYTWTWEMEGGKTYYFNGKANNYIPCPVTNITYTPDPVDFTKYTVTPGSQEPIEGSIEQVTISWGYPIEVLNTSDVQTDWGMTWAYIALSDPSTGEYLTVNNGGITVNVSDKTLVVTPKNALVNITSEEWPLNVSLVILPGAIKVNGQTFEGEDGMEMYVSWQLLYDNNAVKVGDPVITPAKTSNQTPGFDNITISWYKSDGFWIDTDCFNAIKENAKVYVGEDGWGLYDPSWNGSNAWAVYDITSVTGINPKGTGTSYYETVQLNFSAEVGKFETPAYSVYIPRNTIVLDNGETTVTYAENIGAWYHISAAALWPANYQEVEANEFDGLRIQGTATVTNAGAIQLFQGHDPKTNDTPLATGVLEGANLVTFPAAGTLVNGTYSIKIPKGAISGIKDETIINFSITGNAIKYEDLELAQELNGEASTETVEMIESVMIAWSYDGSSYLKIEDPNNPDIGDGLLADFAPTGKGVTGTYSVDGGDPQTIEWSISKRLIESASDKDSGAADGADYEYALIYTPDEPITTGGEYIFTLPANTVTIYINGQNQVSNEIVNVNVTVKSTAPLGDPEIEPTKKTFSGYAPIFIASWNEVQWADLEEDSYKVLSEDEMKQIKVYFNGVENTAWLSWMGAEVRVANTQGTNNQGAEGDADTDNGEGTYKVANISIYLGDMTKYYIPDDTEIKIVIPAGFETTTDGQPTPEVEMTFTKVPLTVEAPEIDPESGYKFVNEVPAFTVTIEDGFGMNYYSSNVTYTVNGGAPVEITGDNMKALKDFGYYGSQASSIEVTLGELPTEPGTYTYVVNIPKNGWQITNLYDEEAELPEAITLTYTLVVEGPQLVTFTVEGEENYMNLEYAALTLEEFMGDPTEFAMQPMTSDSFEVLLNAGEGPTNVVILKPAEGYTMTIDCDVPAYAGEGAYTWQDMSTMFSAVDSETQVFIGLGAGAAGAKFDITLTEIVEPVPALVAEDFEMTFTKGQTTPVTTDVYVSLENVEDMYSYAGYQFDITLPFGMEVTKAALGTGIEGMEDYEQPISVAKVDNMPPTTYRVLGFFEPTTATEKIAKLTISGVYDEDMNNGEKYPVTIQNTVVFSTPTGGDRKEIEGSVSNVTIYIDENLANKVTIESCKLLWPSYTSRKGNIEYITEGQAVELTAVLEPTTAADEITWTATVNGSDNLGIQVSSLDEDDTQNLVVKIATDWEMLNLEDPITVVIKAQAKTKDVYAEYPLTVKPIVLGDANDNDEVNVADVVTTANYIANADDEATIADFVAEFDLPNADVNQNNNSMEGSVNGINVTDVTAIVNIALGTQTGRSVRRYTGSYVSSDRLVAARVSDSSIAVALDGQTAYAALQVEIEMPAGMSVYGVEKGARAAAHELTYGVNARGNVVVVLYSLDNSSFADGEGSLFTLQVEGGNAEDMRLVNAFASDARSNGYELEGVYSSEVTGIFGIEAELASGVRYYTVDGVQVVNPEKGQILIRVQNGQSTKVLVK